ncbi:MAG: sensory rhodopsin transducer, partial [Candidatus Eremiobacteraeota bacterium]|nr:sensory rhodopsin transducer [Candidatus Eremiobacteraeota bacterium]
MIPLRCTGAEPENTSCDKLSILNTGIQESQLELVFYYSDRGPIRPYRLKVPAQRIFAFRINDLIDPQAVPLKTDYALVLTASRPVFVQFTRKDIS